MEASAKPRENERMRKEHEVESIEYDTMILAITCVLYDVNLCYVQMPHALHYDTIVGHLWPVDVSSPWWTVDHIRGAKT